MRSLRRSLLSLDLLHPNASKAVAPRPIRELSLDNIISLLAQFPVGCRRTKTVAECRKVVLQVKASPMSLARASLVPHGPTAVGKTAIGLALAERIGAEIISMDSMAVYRGMDIGTAKPSAADRLRVPHHLTDVVSPYEDFSLARYLETAAAIAAEIHSRGREVLFVGGTPLYLKGLLRGIFQGPAADWQFRSDLTESPKGTPPDGSTGDWPRSILRRPPDCTPMTSGESFAPWRSFTRRVTPLVNCSSNSSGACPPNRAGSSSSTALGQCFTNESTAGSRPCLRPDWSMKWPACCPIPAG